MAAFAILVGIKGSKHESIIIDDPALVKIAFKDEVAKGGKCKFDSIEIVSTRTGRTNRWRNTKPTVDAPEKSKSK
jgi:hypothetical protein